MRFHTNFLNINNTPQKMQKQVNSDLKYLYRWLLANKISLNCAKTEFIFFKREGQEFSFEFKIKMNGVKIPPSKQIKYLGIYLGLSSQWGFPL